MRRTAAILLAFALSSPLAAQQGTPPPPSTPPSDEIVVEGLRDLDDSRSAVTRATLGSGRVGAGARRSRQTFDMAARFADCAIKPDMAGRDMLRAALDGTINGAGQRFWQGRLISMKSACAQDPAIARQSGIATIDPAYDTTYYDRGAMFVRAIKAFAPDLRLTKAQTADPVVHARFNAREVPLAKFRLPVDRQYFETAVCVVRLQPELSVRLVQVTDIDGINRVEAAVVNGARVCVGNARRVYFDPAQFRMYIADAVYRWAVAARGVDSLIPSDK